MIHEYEGDAFCVALVDGVPCLGEANDQERHIIYKEHAIWFGMSMARKFGAHQNYFVYTEYRAGMGPKLAEIHENKFLACGNAQAIKDSDDFEFVWVEGQPQED